MIADYCDATAPYVLTKLRSLKNRADWLLRPREGCEILWRVCQFFSVHLHNSKTTRPIVTSFYACCQWPWLGPPITTLRYIIYFRFCGWRCLHNMGSLGQDHTRSNISMTFAWWRHQFYVRQLVFRRLHQNTALGAKCAIYECLVFQLF